MKPSLLIWDWNGTVLDDMQVSFDIANEMLAERNIKTLPDMAAYREYFGFPIKEYYERMGYCFDVESYEAVSDEFVEMYLARFRQSVLRTGVEEAMVAIEQAGIPQVLLSATREDQLIMQVGCFGTVGDHFEQKLGLSNHYAFSKAALAKDFIEGRGLKPETCLFIGDTNHDYEVSSAIGCPCVLLTGGHQSRHRLEETGAPVFDTMEELLEYIEVK